MRTFNLVILFLLFFFYSFSNTAKGGNENTILKVDLSQNVLTEEQTLPKGNYELKIFSNFNCNEYIITSSFKITNQVNEPLDTSLLNQTSNDSKDISIKKSCIYSGTKKFEIKKRTVAELVITAKKITDGTTKVYTRKYESIISNKWITSIGISAISLLNSDTYKTQVTEDGIKIVRDGSQTILQPIPMLQFSYINLEKDVCLGYMGGIGIDIDELSVFAGGTFYVGHNLFLSAGLAFHQQLRLENQYTENDIVSAEISAADLNEKYYRINPFVSLTFRMDKNIFKNDN
ncbi:hypothetical protein GCM10022393_40680 [Aquimarina addita]|uniref:Outer membrane protein beta-barrel domain-containing protein n=1 Tax=Aquimarina addita TaxID=870485 RepID=A0ABP6UWL7_9FLAO